MTKGERDKEIRELEKEIDKILASMSVELVRKPDSFFTSADYETWFNKWRPKFLFQETSLSSALYNKTQDMEVMVAETIRQGLRNKKTMIEIARGLFEGYNFKAPNQEILQVINHQLPKKLRQIRQMAQALSAGGSGDYAKYEKAIKSFRKYSGKLTRGGLTGFQHLGMRSAYMEFVKKLEKQGPESIDKLIEHAMYEKSRYFSQRIVRTEIAKMYADEFIEDAEQDTNCIAIRWMLSAAHPAKDICDTHAKADLYGLGAGVYPKGQVPRLPAHPHCLCHYQQVRKSVKQQIQEAKERFKAEGKEWYNDGMDVQRKAEKAFIENVEKNLDLSSIEGVLQTFPNLWVAPSHYKKHLDKRKSEHHIRDDSDVLSQRDYIDKIFNVLSFFTTIHIEIYPSTQSWSRVLYNLYQDWLVVLSEHGDIISGYKLEKELADILKKDKLLYNAIITEGDIDYEFQKRVRTIRDRIAGL